MHFFTKVPISASENPIGYDSKIVSIGSCFAENMGAKLHYYQFQQTINPFGIIFNPISIENIIRRAVKKEYFDDKDVFFNDERWHCFEVHSDLSFPHKDLFLKKLNTTLIDFFDQISNATHLVITLGTSWVYKTIATQKFAANCHKMPQKEFSKHLLSSSDVLQAMQNSLDLVREINPNCSFIFTISPVRHLKDGFIENQISKANLISAVYNLTQNQAEKSRLHYFPSYEIMMDELRDYRFYGQDLLHPNATAIDYIWLQFVEFVIEKSTIATMNEVESIQKGLLHRSFNPSAISHQKFLENIHAKIGKLQTTYPFMNFLQC